MRQQAFHSLILAGLCVLVSGCANTRQLAYEQIYAQPTGEQFAESQTLGSEHENAVTPVSFAQSDDSEPAGAASIERQTVGESPPLKPVQDSTTPNAESALPQNASPSPVGELQLSPGEMTLSEVEHLALTNNPTLQQADAMVTAKLGDLVQAGLYPNPRLGYMHGDLGNAGSAGQQGLYMAVEVVRGGKIELAEHAANHAAQAADFRRVAQNLKVLTSVRSDFYSVLAAQQTLKLADDLATVSRNGVKTTEALIEGGQASRVDLLQARVQLNNARIAVQKARNRHTAAWARLAANIGLPDLKPTHLAGSLDADLKPQNPDAAFQQLLATSPELASAHQEANRARAALDRALVEPTPNVDVQAGVQYDYATDSSLATIQLEMPLPVRNRNQGNILRAEAELFAAQQEIQRVTLRLRQRFAAANERLANAAAEVHLYRTEIVPDAKESLQLLSDAFQAEGRMDFVRLLIAQRTNFQTRIEYLQALRKWWLAKLELDGQLLTGGLDAPTTR